MIKQIKTIVETLMVASLKASRKENFCLDFIQKLEKILPSLKDQMNYLNDNIKEYSTYLQYKIRNQQAFQLDFTLNAFNQYKKNKGVDSISIIDIGDSSGNHLIQLCALDESIKQVASVNLDEEAIKKIQAKGIKAYHCRAEDLLEKHNVRANFFISYQMVEHLTDPTRFFHNIAYSQINNINVCDRFIVSVPYQKRSRVGFSHIRANLTNTVQNAESVHIFELSPNDWQLLVKFAGWEIVSDKIYFQYPKWHWLYFMKYIWKRFDFEGFYIMELKIDHTWSKDYMSW